MTKSKLWLANVGYHIPSFITSECTRGDAPTHPMTIRALWTELQELHTNISKMVVVQIDLDGDYGDCGD
jgi:hypothetical protein